MADESAVGRASCRVAAVASGVALLLAVILAQYQTVATRAFLLPQYQRLHAELPNGTMWLVANYPAGLGTLVIVLVAAWLVATFFLRQGTVVVVINSILMLVVLSFMALHGWAVGLPYLTLGRT
jgi:hypothetical protein